MVLQVLDLGTIHLPTHPEIPLLLEDSPLRILSEISYNNLEEASDLSPAIGIATVLYNWNPSALLALLDIKSWFSLTWTLTLPDSTKLEIGRIRNQITFGKLDGEGLWDIMLTFTISQSEEEEEIESKKNGLFQGMWIPNTEESMLGDANISDAIEIENLGRGFVKELIEGRRWLTGSKTKHEFFIESESLGMDPWADGLAMNPHWLYEALDLNVCTTCKSRREEQKPLNRCGRCGTAAYCCGGCQRKDWAVHKAVCGMSAEGRGKALAYSQNGGLVNWVDEDGTLNQEVEEETNETEDEVN